ncbi:MAG TPA: GGDEF domain-containing protein [Pseudolabrys sp.]|nr:GGDEF domain-containing protein [Pseudolabrys sp.]
MVAAASLQSSSLDVPTLSFVAACLAGFLGLFLIVAWLQQRDVRALAWWGSAYLIGAASIALWGAPAPLFKLPPEFAEALIFVACGMIWNGVRLFHGRRLWPLAAFAGAIVWLILSQIPVLSADSNARIALGAIVVAIYTFFIAFELARERRKSFYSRTAAIVVPCLYAAIFLMPLAMRAFLPETIAVHWLTVLALETIIYAVGTAFIVLLMVKDHHVRVYRQAATTDSLTGLLNRGAFMDGARSLCALQARQCAPVTLLMFDLDHFKSINDRFGHATGDDVLRVFAKVASSGMRANDIIGRLGGEEFAAIVPEGSVITARIAERLRAAFEKAGVEVGVHVIGATVSIGTATANEPVTDIDALIARADAALYGAKHGGRNRVQAAGDGRPNIHSGHAGSNGGSRANKAAHVPRKSAARQAKHAVAAVTGEGATPRLLYPR